MLLLFVLFGILQAQKNSTNLSIADQMYRQLLDSLVSEIREPQFKAQHLASVDKLFLRSGWIQFWTKAKEDAVQDTTKYVFVAERFGFDVFYKEESARLLGFNNKLLRQAEFSLQGWLEYSQSGKVYKNFSVHKIQCDTVDSRILAKIEKSPFSFTKGTMKTKSVWMRYIEPALVLVTVSTIIYLFFSVRT